MVNLKGICDTLEIILAKKFNICSFILDVTMANSVPEVSAKIADVSLSMHLTSSVKIMLYFKILDIATVLHTVTYMIPHFGIQLKCSALSTLGGCDVDQGLAV